MKKLLFILALLTGSALAQCTSSTPANLQACINAAVSGSTITVSAGSATATLTISGKKLTIVGAGVGNTNFTCSGGTCLNITATAVNFVDFSGFTFTGGNNSNGAIQIDGTMFDVAFRLHHISLTTTSNRGIFINHVYGLIDHATITQTGSGCQSLTFQGANDGNQEMTLPWTRALSLGTNQAVYVEDSTLNFTCGNDSLIDSYGGARWVFRHNTANMNTSGEGFGGGHGTDSGDRWGGPISFEVYSNNLNNTGAGNQRGGTIRGGTGVWFGNTFTGSIGGLTLMIYRACTTLVGGIHWAQCNGTGYRVTSGAPSNFWNNTTNAKAGSNCSTDGIASNCAFCSGNKELRCSADATCAAAGAGTCSTNFDGTGSGGYPCRNQPGVAPGQIVDPIYSWLNGSHTISTYNGGTDDCGPPGGLDSVYLVSGRDYVNNGSTPKPGYTPYTYPHPLQGGTQPTISLTPTSLTFSSQVVGIPSATQTVTMQNTATGVADLTVASISPAGTNSGDFSLTENCTGHTIPTGSSCAITVTFTPLAVGARSATIAIVDNATGSPHSVPLSGTGAPTTASLTPNPLDFGPQTVGSTSSPLNATLTNTGTGNLTFSSFGITNSAIFAFIGTTCSGVLGPGASCTASITFSPPNTGSFSGTLTATTDASNSPNVINLTGVGGTSHWRLGRLGIGAARWGRNAGLPTENVYIARTDQCETSGTGSDTGCTGQLPMTFLGRSTSIGGIFSPVDIPPDLTTSGNPLYGMNKCNVDPDFHTKICRATDYSMNALGSSFGMGAGGDVQLWAKDSSAFFIINSGGLYRLLKFDGATMSTAATSIGGTGTPLCATNCTTLAEGDISFSSTDGNTLYELDLTAAPAHYYLNQLTLVKTVDPSTWSFNRVHLYDFHDSTHCLPLDFDPNWTGSFNISADDNVFAFALGDHGQNGVRDATHYGATFMVIYDKRQSGCRILNTYGTGGVGPMAIDGDWGPTGVPLLGTDLQTTDCTSGNVSPLICYPNAVPEGTSQGPVLLDSLYFHNGGPTANNKYIAMSGSDISACQVIASGPYAGRNSCYCKNGANQNLCEAYTWEFNTLNIRPNSPQGHNVKGNLGSYRGTNYAFFTYHDPYMKLSNLLSINIPVDQHGTPTNLDSVDHQPIAFATSNACGQGAGANGTPCDADYGTTGNNAFYDEFVAVENQGAYCSSNPPVGPPCLTPPAQHCNYGAGATACAYRFAHTFSSGTSWNFGPSQAISNISPDGQFALISTDWFAHSSTVAGKNSGFGCTNGFDGMTAGQLCINALDSNGNGTKYPITAVSESPLGDGKTVTFTSTMNPIVGSVLTVKGFVTETRYNKQWTVLTSSSSNWTAHATVTGLLSDSGGTGNYDCGNGSLSTQPCARGDVVVINLRTAGTVH